MLFINHLTACVHWRLHEGHNESIIFQPQLPVCASVSVNRERLQIGGSEEATEDEDTWLLASSMSPLFVVWVEVAVPAAVFEEVQAERGSICVFKHSHNNRCRREQSLLGFEWRRLCTQRMNVPLTTPRKQNAKWCPWLLHQLNERRELSRRVQIYSRCVWEFQSVHLRSELQRLQLKPQDLRTSSVVGAGVTEHF